ncbi:MAG: ferritin family protein [Planctomycetaceae bacterium]|nr:ferritin family protein [Planctomycetaceae bacterium]
MADTGDIVDILMVGVNRETEANIFYNIMSQYTEDPQVILMCKQFAEEELVHKTNLELEIFKLGKTVSDRPKISNSTPLDFMVDLSKVSQMDCGDLLVIAMNKEKEAFRFYMELYAMTTEPEFREVLMEMAEEEARHKLRFEIHYDLYMSAKKPIL